MKLIYLLLICFPLMGMNVDIKKELPKIAKPSKVIKARVRMQTYFYKPIKLQKKPFIKKQIIEISEWVIIEKDSDSSQH